MADTSERPAARRRPRAAADETSDPMDTAASLAPPPAPPPTAPSSEPTAPSATISAPSSVAPSPSPSPPPIGERSTQPPTPALPHPPSGAYVTLNVRVSIEIDQLLGRAMAENSMTKRAAVENALRRTYG